MFLSKISICFPFKQNKQLLQLKNDINVSIRKYFFKFRSDNFILLFANQNLNA